MFKDQLAPLWLLFSWTLFIFWHLIFLKYFLYWHIVWLDLFMHAGGGMLLVASWYYIKHAGAFSLHLRKTWLHPLICLVFIMISWEVFKYLIGSITSEAYVLDTTLDLAFGFFGGLVSFWLFRSRTIGR